MEDVLEICAIAEIVHNGSLIFDDVEDSSETRRNKKCVHLIFGIDVAINTACLMYFAPFKHLLDSKSFTATQKLEFT